MLLDQFYLLRFQKILETCLILLVIILKIPKNSIVFIALTVIVIAFIVGAIFWYLDDGQEDINLQRTGIPELSEEPITYTSKLEALNNLEETKERTAPSIYQEYDKDSLNNRSPSSGINPSIPMQDSLLPNPPPHTQSSKKTAVGNSSANHLNPSLTRSSHSFKNHFNLASILNDNSSCLWENSLSKNPNLISLKSLLNSSLLSSIFIKSSTTVNSF